MLKPVEVLFSLGFDAPEVHRPADREKLRSFVDVVLLDDPVPSCADVVMMNLHAVLLQRQHVRAIVIFVNPTVPELCVRLLVLVAVGGAVLDQRTDRCIDNGVVLPKCVTKIALQQQVIAGVINQRHQQRVTIADVTRFIGLHRQKHRGQRVVAIACCL